MQKTGYLKFGSVWNFNFNVPESMRNHWSHANTQPWSSWNKFVHGCPRAGWLGWASGGTVLTTGCFVEPHTPLPRLGGCSSRAGGGAAGTEIGTGQLCVWASVAVSKVLCYVCHSWAGLFPTHSPPPPPKKKLNKNKTRKKENKHPPP